jgi:hypothetical protein
MSRRSRIRKRSRKKRQYAQRPKQADKPVVSPTAGIIAQLARPTRAIAFAEALNEIQQKA